MNSTSEAYTNASRLTRFGSDKTDFRFLLGRIPIVLSLLLVTVLLCATFAAGEEFVEWNLLRAASYRAQSLEDIEQIYRALPPKPASIGSIDRDRYYIWALSNYLFDTFFCRGGGQIIGAVNDLSEFEDKAAGDVKALALRLRELNPELPQITDLIILAHAKYIFDLRSIAETNLKPVVTQINTLKEQYRSKVTEKTSPAYREALAMVFKTRGSFTDYYNYKEESGPSAMFLLADLNKHRYMPPEVKKRADMYSRHRGCPITPIIETRQLTADIKVDTDFHPMLIFYDKAPKQLFSAYRKQSESSVNQKGISEYRPYITNYFKEAPNFITHHYGSEHFEPMININRCPDAIIDYSLKDSHYAIFADIRTIHVSGEYKFYRNARELLDKRSQYYNRFMRLAAMCDKPDACYDSELWNIVAPEKLPEFGRYDEYLKQCDVYLAAYYTRTVKTTAMFQMNTFQKETQFLTPDFSIEPTIFTVFIPDGLLRFAAQAGVHQVIFISNAMGIGDITTSYPED